MQRALLKAGFTWKKRFRPSEQARPKVQERRAAFREALSQIPLDRLVVLDESGCNLAMSTAYGRARRGDRVFDHKPANWGENLSVVGAVRADRVLCHQIFVGAVNGPRFVEFVRETLAPRLYPGAVVVLDNLKPHHAPVVRELVEAVGARLLFLPPYSPDLSPIEPCWSFVVTTPQDTYNGTAIRLAPATGGQGYVTSSVVPFVAPSGGTLIVSAAAKTSGSISQAYVLVYGFTGANGSGTQTMSMSHTVTGDPNQFKVFFSTAAVPTTTRSIYVQLVANGGGSVEFDDLRLSVVY